MTILLSATRVLSRFMYVIAGIALTASMVLTVSDVLLCTLKHPITGTYELVGLLGAVVIGFSLPQTSRVRGHVVMHFLTERLSDRVGKVLRVVTRTLGIAMFGVIGWNLVVLGHNFKETGETTATLLLPLYPVCYGIAVCCFVECLVLLAEILARGENQL